MSNPTDPTRPDPDQPEPKKPDEAAGPRVPTGRSSFEFELPPDVGTYSDMPPIPQPDAGETGGSTAPLPPRPLATERPSNVSFDFIELPAEPAAPGSGAGLKGVPVAPVAIDPLPAEPPLLTPTTSDFTLPPTPPGPQPMSLTEDDFDFADPMPMAAPASGALSEPTINLAPPEVPAAPPSPSAASVPDVSTLYAPVPEVPQVPEVPAVPEIPPAQVPEVPAAELALPEFELPELEVTEGDLDLGELELPVAEPASDIFGGATGALPVAEPASDVFGGATLNVPTAEPASGAKSAPRVVVTPVVKAAPPVEASAAPQPPAPAPTPASTPDLDAALADFAPASPIDPVAPASGWLETPEPIPVPAAEVPEAEPASGIASAAPAEPAEAEVVAEAQAAEEMPPTAEPAVTEALVAEWVEAEPVAAEAAPADAELIEAGATGAEPVAAELVEAEPVEAELIEAVPVEAEAPAAEPVEAEPVVSEPAELLAAEPVEVEALPAEPVTAGPTDAELFDPADVAEAEPADAPTLAAEEVAEAQPVEPAANRSSSFDFQLPSSGDLSPLIPPGADDATGLAAALPPAAVSAPVPGASFDFINVPDAPGSGAGLEGVPLTPTTIDPLGEADEVGEAPILVPTAGVIVLPPEAEIPVADAAGDSGAALGAPAEAVQPASGWLDSDVVGGPVPVAEAVPDSLGESPRHAVESSDIFSGARAAPALPVEHSDVIAATAYAAEDAGPVEPARPSEVALNFDAPPGGSTAHDSAASDLPVAAEVGDSSALLAELVELESDSIHDMPDPASDPLFDSAKLADAPDLPPAPAPRADDAPDYGAAPAFAADASSILPDDATDFGATPAFGADASSILADLGAPGESHGPDSSHVPVEAPGMDRTISVAPDEGGFDLTVPDEPIPADLFDESVDVTLDDATDWQSQSGSDLFADGRTSPELDPAPDSGRVEPVDADLAPEQPSLTSAPSSIFSGGKPPPPGSGSVPVGSPEATGDFDFGEVEPADAELADAAEFSDHPTLGETAEQSAVPAVPPRAPSAADLELPDEVTTPAAEEDGGAIDWDAAELASDEGATQGIPRDASLSAIIRGLSEETVERPAHARAAAEEPAEGDSEPVVSVDWMASSSESSALAEPLPAAAEAEEPPKPRREKDKKKGREERDERPRPAKARRPEPAAEEEVAGTAEKPTKPSRAEPSEKVKKEKERPAKKGGGLVVGALLGALLAGGACAGAYFGGLVPNGEKSTGAGPQANNGGTANPTPPAPTPTIGPKDAFAIGDVGKALEMVKANPAATAEERATAGSVRVYAKVHGTGTDADLKQGQDDLKAVIAEAAKSPDDVKRAVKATVDLGVSYEEMGDTAAAKRLFTQAKAKFPGYAAVFDALLDRLDSGPAGGTSFRPTPADVEKVLLSVGVMLADGPKAGDAVTADPEPGQFYWKAVRLAREGNYKEAIDLIGKAKAAHVKRAKALAGRGLNPLTDPLEQMFPRSCDELAAYWKLKGELYSSPDIADAIKKDGVARTLDSLVQSQKALAVAKADLKATSEKVEKLDKDLKVAEADVKALEKKLDAAGETLLAAQKQSKERYDALAAVAQELKPAVPLPEKWGPAELVAAARTAAGRATGPDLKKLVPNAMTAIGGGGLSAGQLLDIADRLTKAEAAAKVATDRLTGETKKLTEKYEGDIKKVKDDSAAELKKLTDSYAADLKKLQDTSAANLKKLKEENADEVKKLMDKSAADLKRLKEDYDALVKAEQAKTEAEKRSAAIAAIGFQKQLALSFSPSSALDLWLPVLTDLRRPVDADPAIDIARRALATARPDSDEEAKAQTTVGMALLLKGNFAGARDEFLAAKRSPAYKANKAWARVADAGLEATTDPLAPYRQPVVLPPVDRAAAAKSLNDGIVAYRAGKYRDAVEALSDAAKNDPTDPVAWYFLGATRWAMGNEEQAKKDFAQGSEREKVSPLPGRTISDALAPLQGNVRDAIDKLRP